MKTSEAIDIISAALVKATSEFPSPKKTKTNPHYKVWCGMKARCDCQTATGYSNYGARGITVCERWRDFASFVSDIGPRPSMGHTLNRVDNDGHYEPGNCNWATKQEQNYNKRTNTFVTVNGVTRTVSEWSRVVGLAPCTVHERIRRGWDIQEAVTLPSRRRKVKFRWGDGRRTRYYEEVAQNTARLNGK